MQINFTGHNLEITPALRSFTNEKFSRLKRHHDRINSIDVTFSIENLQQIAEANIHIPGNKIHAKSEAEILYSAIDTLVDKLDKQLLKHKEKMQDHH
jgi:putative sigma-54 modulation protein